MELIINIILFMLAFMLVFFLGYMAGINEPIIRGNEDINIIQYKSGKFYLAKESKKVYSFTTLQQEFTKKLENW
jgi:hypothetical protein